MRPTTALCFLALGLVLVAGNRIPPRVQAMVGFLVCATTSIVLFEHFNDVQNGVFDWLVPQWDILSAKTVIELRMSGPTAIGLWLGGTSILLRPVISFAGPLAAILIGLTSLLVLIDFPGLDPLAKSLPTTFSTWFLAIGLFSSNRERLAVVSLPFAMATLVFSALLPALILLESQLRNIEGERRASIEAKTKDIANQVVDLAERFIGDRATMLDTLAASPALRSGDLAAFHDHIKGLAPDSENAIVLSDRSHQIILDTRNPYGTKLPRVVDTETAERVFATGRQQVSNLFIAPKSGDYVLSVVVPVPRSEYVLRSTSTGAALSNQLKRIAPAGWTLAILDGKGVISARNADPENWVGRQARPERWAHMTAQKSGELLGPGLKGKNG